MVIRLNKNTLFRILLLKAMVMFLVGAVFSVLFLASSYDHLIKWYFSLNSCFYRYDHWTSEIFTIGTKAHGNSFCTIALLLCIAALAYIYSIKKKTFANPTLLIIIGKNDLFVGIVITLLCVGLWLYGNLTIGPAYDEVFSAVNCSGIHPFQSLSYYMLPNNHIGFNFLNGILFHFVKDKVASGRLISLVAFIGIAIIVYAFLRMMIRSLPLSLIGTITVLIQLPIWGFSFQARGYEWYAFAELLLFVSVYKYIVTENNKWLYLNIIAGIIGYFFIPTYLYIHVAQIIFCFLYQAVTRKIIFKYWFAQLICFAVVFILYLPALCFSGVHMLLNNPYVSPGGDTNWIVSHAIPYLKEYATYCYSAIYSEYNWINIVLFLSPLLLFLFYKQKPARLIALFYTILWCTLYVIVFKMKKFPFMRNSIGHVALSLVFFELTVYWLLEYFRQKLKVKMLTIILFPAFIILLWVHLVPINSSWLNLRLYNYPVNTRIEIVRNGLKLIPSGATVGFSDESFFWYYLFSKNNQTASKCLLGNEDYMVKQIEEPFPEQAKGKYDYIKTTEIYEVYKLKKEYSKP